MKNSFRQNKGRGTLVATTILVCAVIAADMLGGGTIHRALRSGVSAFGDWYERAYAATIGSGVFASRRALAEENARLRNEVSELAEHDAAYRAALDENELLRSLVHIADREDAAGITAPVISSTSVSPYDTFHIGAGRAEGVQQGGIVLSPAGFVVGDISDAGEHSATVHSIFAPGRQIEMTIGDDTAGKAEGRGGSAARADVPREAIVPVGSVARAPLFGARPFAIVSGLESASSSATARLFLGSPVNLEALRFVYILPPEMTP